MSAKAYVLEFGMGVDVHGLEFGLRVLRPGASAVTICGASLELTDAALHISALPS